MNKNVSLLIEAKDSFLAVSQKLTDRGYKVNSNHLTSINGIAEKTILVEDFYNNIIVWMDDISTTMSEVEAVLKECDRVLKHGDFSFTFVVSKDMLNKYFELFEKYHFTAIYMFSKNEVFDYDKLEAIVNGKFKTPHAWKREYLPTSNEIQTQEVESEVKENMGAKPEGAFKSHEVKKDENAGIKRKPNVDLFGLLDNISFEEEDETAKEEVVEEKKEDVKVEEKPLSPKEIAERDKVGMDMDDEELIAFKGMLCGEAFKKKRALIQKKKDEKKKAAEEAKKAAEEAKKEAERKDAERKAAEQAKKQKVEKDRKHRENMEAKAATKDKKGKMEEDKMAKTNHRSVGKSTKGEVNIHLFNLENFKGKQVNDMILKGIISQAVGGKNTIYVLLDGGFVQTTSMNNLDMLDAMITATGGEIENLVEQSVVKTGFGFDSLNRVKEKSGTIANIHKIIEVLSKKYDIVNIIGSFDTASNITLGKEDVNAKLYLNHDTGILQVREVTEQASNKLQANLLEAITSIEDIK